MQLGPVDHLTFLTDGVLEARNAAGELLGFDRLAQLSSLAPEAIADAAITHGQDDDITVVSIQLRGQGDGQSFASSREIESAATLR